MLKSQQLRLKRTALIEQAEAIVSGAVSERRSITQAEDSDVARLLEEAEEVMGEVRSAEAEEDRERNLPATPRFARF